MTAWMGNAQTTVKPTGVHGGQIRVGRFIVPKHVFLDVEGRNGDPDLHAHFEWREGRPQVVELTVTAKPDGRGVRSVDLDSLSLDRLARTVFAEHSKIKIEPSEDGVTVSAMPDWDDERFAADRWELDGHLDEAISSTRGGKSRAELARVAAIYERHRGHGALLAVAADLEVSPRTAARRIKQARAEGLLVDPANGEDK
jgi:hypothetical protein